jgi:serine/threonine protein kinase
MSFFKEIEILSKCHHPNIVKLLDASLNGVITKEALLRSGAVRKTSVEYSKIE